MSEGEWVDAVELPSGYDVGVWYGEFVDLVNDRAGLWSWKVG